MPRQRRLCQRLSIPTGGSVTLEANEAAPDEQPGQEQANVETLPQVIVDSVDPKLLERLKLANRCLVRQRIAAEVFAETRDQKQALTEAGYKFKRAALAWSRLMTIPHFKEYLEYLQALRMTQPDSIWCLERLVAIVNEPKAPAAARVSAIERIGRMKQVKGLCDVEQEKGGTTVTIPVKVFVGIDPEKI